MAISIDNARIHYRLEHLLEERSKALDSAEAQVQSLFENSPLGIALTSFEGQFLAVNKAISDMLCISEARILRCNVMDFYHDPSVRGALLKQIQEHGILQDFGVSLVRNDGSVFFASLNISRLVLAGNEVLLTIVEDVTEQITAEQDAAIRQERERLARELHDSVTQTLYSASLIADTMPAMWQKKPAVAEANLAHLGVLLRTSLAEMRTLLHELRPSTLRDRTLGQLVAPLIEAARTRTMATVTFDLRGETIYPIEITLALFRIVQEGLNNVVKHAEATEVRVEMACESGGVDLSIRDNGRGFDPANLAAGHLGIGIMRERAAKIDAAFQLKSKPGKGTHLHVAWPAEQKEDADG
jgi:PAS domain S-box-containing protein